MKGSFLIGLCVSLLYCGSSYSQRPDDDDDGYNAGNKSSDGYLTGTILDSSNDQPVGFAVAAIYNQEDSSLVNGQMTDSLGVFKFKDMAYGLYYVDIRFIGFRNKRLTGISVTPDKKSVNLGEIRMENMLTDLGNVVVKGERPQMSYKIDRNVVYV